MRTLKKHFGKAGEDKAKQALLSLKLNYQRDFLNIRMVNPENFKGKTL
jgi:hypothetical protein